VTDLALVGLNHRSAPLAVRERLFVPRPALPALLGALKEVPGVSEGFILSTCNRTEVLACLDGAREETLVEFLGARHGMAAPALDPYLYRLRSLEAVRHLFRVAASLDSLVVGEPQILGQVKEAYQAALECGALGRVLDGLLQHAFEAAKKVRARTGIARHPVSVSQAAVGLARQIFGTLEGRTVVVLGAGKMSELVVRHLVEEGVRSVIVSNRTYERAVELAERFGGRAARFESLPDQFEVADILIASTGAPHHVLRYDEVAVLVRRRRGRPIFLIDIAVPRDIEPRVNTLENVYLYDLDDLRRVVEENRDGRRREAEQAEALIDEAVARFHAWLRGLDAGPAIAAVRERYHRLKEEELRRFLQRHRDLPEPQRRDLAALLHGLVNKFLHEPTRRLRQGVGRADGAQRVELFRDLFGLEDAPGASAPDRVDKGRPESP
jgi:glutamyl-tRNA reductase